MLSTNLKYLEIDFSLSGDNMAVSPSLSFRLRGRRSANRYLKIINGNLLPLSIILKNVDIKRSSVLFNKIMLGDIGVVPM